MRRSRKPQRRAQQRWAMAERCSALRPPRLVVRTRVRSGFPMAIQCGCADGWRRFRSAGTRSRFLPPVTRHRRKGLPLRVAANRSGGFIPPFSGRRYAARWRGKLAATLAVQRGCSDRWRRFRSAGTRSRFWQPVTRHRCGGSPRRVAASKSGDESPHSERQALHPCPQAVIFRSSAGEEGQARPPPLPASCPPESPGIERMKKRPQPRQREVYWLVTGKAKWRS
jgi:hypothetical protein